MKKFIPALLIGSTLGLIFGCEYNASSDKVQQDQQEVILQEATAATGMPAVKNFTERKFLKMLIELRDQEGLVTYTYTFAEATGQKTFLCESVGYGIPFSTQYTNPEKLQKLFSGGERYVMPQADPSGLFPPTSADSTWVMCKNKGEISPMYVEPKIIVSKYRLD